MGEGALDGEASLALGTALGERVVWRVAASSGAFAPPSDHEPRVLVEQTQTPREPPGRAVLRVTGGSGNTLRRRARDTRDEQDGWSVLEVDFRDLDRLADEVAGFGPDVVATSPDELRHAVVRRLSGALDPGGATATGPADGAPTHTGVGA